MPDIEVEIKESTPIIARKSEIDRQAEENKAKRALPIPPGKLVGFKDLQDWLKLLTTDEQQQRITIWIYRREPIINRQLVDPSADNNIDVIFNSFDKLTEDYMKENHGGGNYKFIVKDADKPKTQMGGFFEAVLNIPMLDCPAKLDLREVEWDNPHNKGFKSWCRAKKLINENNMPVIEKVEGPVVNNAGLDANTVAMMKMILDYTSKMSEKDQQQIKRQIGGEDALSKNIGELMLEKMKQEDPNKQMTSMLTMITAIKSMSPEVKPDNTLSTIMPMFMTMIQQMNEAASRQFQMMMKMFENKTSPVVEKEGSKIDELRSIIELAREIKGGGAGHEKSTTESIIDALAPIVGPVVGIVGNIVAMNAAAKGIKQPTQQMEQTPVTQTLQEQTNMNQPRPTPGLPATSEAANLIIQFEPIILNKLAGEGWEFGAWVADGFGDMAAMGIVKYGVEGLLNAAKSVPSFWGKVEASYGETHLRKWLESLCNYKDIMEQMDKEENGEELPLGIKELKTQ
jgi:hypothetical protein